jgi:hypothetical protein
MQSNNYCKEHKEKTYSVEILEKNGSYLNKNINICNCCKKTNIHSEDNSHYHILILDYRNNNIYYFRCTHKACTFRIKYSIEFIIQPQSEKIKNLENICNSNKSISIIKQKN